MFLCENVSKRLFVRVVVLYGLGLDFFQCACLPVRKWNCCIVQRDSSCLPIILCQRLNLMCWVSLLKFHNRGLPAPLKLCPLVWAWEDEKAHLFTAHSKSDSLSLPYRVRREIFFPPFPEGDGWVLCSQHIRGSHSNAEELAISWQLSAVTDGQCAIAIA